MSQTSRRQKPVGQAARLSAAASDAQWTGEPPVPPAASAAVWEVAFRRRALVVVAGVCGFAAATALAAHVRIPLPFSPVPVTLQTFVVLLAGAALGPAAGAASQGLYLCLGACGVPVFAATAAGLYGPTAGYLLAFPLAAWLVGLGVRRGPRGLALGLLAGTVAVYVLGAGWLACFAGRSLSAALLMGVVPFLPGDAIKLAAAWCLSTGAKNVYERHAKRS